MVQGDYLHLDLEDLDTLVDLDILDTLECLALECLALGTRVTGMTVGDSGCVSV